MGLFHRWLYLYLRRPLAPMVLSMWGQMITTLCRQPRRHPEVGLYHRWLGYHSSPAIGADGTIYVGSWMVSSMPSTPTAPRSGLLQWGYVDLFPGHRRRRHHLRGVMTDGKLYAVNPDGTRSGPLPRGNWPCYTLPRPLAPTAPSTWGHADKQALCHQP